MTEDIQNEPFMHAKGKLDVRTSKTLIIRCSFLHQQVAVLNAKWSKLLVRTLEGHKKSAEGDVALAIDASVRAHIVFA